MKRSIAFINILLIITVFILVIFDKYYPSSILEVYLKDYYTPEKISYVLNEKYPYEYLNIYEILSSEGNVNVYTGNLNIILRNHIMEDYGINKDKDTLIAGDKYLDKRYIYNEDNSHITTKIGEYNLRAVIKNSNEAYYCDTDILKNSQIRRQRLYLILDDSDNPNKYINSETMLRFIKSEGIEVASSIAYEDVSDILKKLILIFCFIQALIGLIYMQKNIINQTKVMIKKYKELKYDIYLRDYLLDKQNIKSIFTVVGKIIAAFVFLIVLLILFVLIINIRPSFSLNPTSYTSIKNTIMLLVNLLNYFFKYGFTDISLAILGILSTYLVLIFLTFIVFMTKFCITKSKRHIDVEKLTGEIV